MTEVPMPRRAGKAASRKARQRKVHRPVVPAGTPPAMPIPPVGTPDAREASSLAPPRRAMPSPSAFLGSNLSDRERAEYHYVERDLRNIGVLTAVMAVLLVVSYFAFSALGLVG
jgi:hypothetical protein